MTKVVKLSGLTKTGKLSNGRTKCTPVRTTEEIEGRQVIVCKEDLVDPQPLYEDKASENCKRRSKSGRCLGRPRGSSPKNAAYRTRKGSRARSAPAKWCSPEDRKWVDAKVGPNKKKARRCRCVAKGNNRYLKNSECK